MIHLGDITKISGYTAPIVDCIIGGSPCQGLSQAGLRKGLADERSGLYIDQVRIVKEMRERDKRNGRTGVDIRPRYMVWENVYGALSSGEPKSEDFRIVLEELAKIADKDAVIPMPPKGKWTSCGCIMGDGWSIAWRILDAQFWGTPRKPLPQRRRRVSLIADFGGQSAPEILFVRESLSGNIEPGREKGQGTPAHAEGSPVADHREGSGFDGYNGDLTGDVSATLGVNCGLSTGRNGVIYPAYTMQDREGCAGGGKGALIQTDRSAALRCQNAQVQFQPVTFSKSKRAQSDTDHIPSVVYALDRAAYNQGKNAQFDFEVSDSGVNSPLVAKGPGAVCYGINGDKAGTLDSSYYKGCGMRSGVERDVVAVDCRNCSEDSVNGALQTNSAHSLNGNNVVRTRYIVRRLTPLECERLQGFPDGWTDIGEWVDSNGKKHQSSDAARYKALGNSIALPPWKWVLKRLCACYERDATMASLFDGIGGFPYLWEQLNGKGTCLWASEIEDFPIAVTKVRIGE